MVVGLHLEVEIPRRLPALRVAPDQSQVVPIGATHINRKVIVGRCHSRDGNLSARAAGRVGKENGRLQRPTAGIESRLAPGGSQVSIRGLIAPRRAVIHDGKNLGRNEWIGKVAPARGPADFVGGHPILAGATGRVGIDLRQGGAGAVRSSRPLPAVVILERVHRSAVVVQQVDPFSGIGQMPRIGPQCIVETGLSDEFVRRGGDDQVSLAGKDRPGAELVVDGPVESPSRQIHIDGHLIVQLDPFEILVARRRMIHQLVEDHRRVGREQPARLQRLKHQTFGSVLGSGRVSY